MIVQLLGRNARTSLSFSPCASKDVFDRERPTCSPPVLRIFEETGTSCVLLGYVEFRQQTFFQRSENGLVGVHWDIFSAARAHDVFPRSQFGLRTDQTVAYQPRRAPKTGGLGLNYRWDSTDGARLRHRSNRRPAMPTELVSAKTCVPSGLVSSWIASKWRPLTFPAQREPFLVC